MANILEIKNLVVSYGGIEAVKGIDLTVEEGKIVTLVGSNGAGKSTTLKSIAGPVTSSLTGRACSASPPTRSSPPASRSFPKDGVCSRT